MDIYEALDKLNNFLSMLSCQGVLTEDEISEIEECEEVIYAFARKHQPD